MFFTLINISIVHRRIVFYIKKLEKIIDILAFHCIEKMQTYCDNHSSYLNDLNELSSKHKRKILYKQDDDHVLGYVKINDFLNPFRSSYDIDKKYGS